MLVELHLPSISFLVVVALLHLDFDICSLLLDLALSVLELGVVFLLLQLSLQLSLQLLNSSTSSFTLLHKEVEGYNRSLVHDLGSFNRREQSGVEFFDPADAPSILSHWLGLEFLPFVPRLVDLIEVVAAALFERFNGRSVGLDGILQLFMC